MITTINHQTTTMKYFLITFILTLPLLPSAPPTTHRRILHQPLFPANSTTPPPPGPPTSDNPFFHEAPNQQTPDQQTPNQPPPEVPATHPISPAPAKKSGKKVAVVISVGIVTLGMLSGLAFFVYKHKSKQHIESVNDSEDLPPARFLDVGTDSVNGSPYNDNNNNITTNNNKLNSVKTFNRYRPSPDLQPLPPLSKLPVSEAEEEEIHDFYTPHGSTASTDEGYSVRGLNIKRIHRKVSSPNSKRSSPRSRLSVCSSPDSIISPVKQPPPIKTTSTSPAAKVIPKIIKPISSQYTSDDDLQADDGLKPKMKPPRP